MPAQVRVFVSAEFADERIVVCPRCKRCWAKGKFAVYIKFENEVIPRFLAEKITCECGLDLLPPKLFDTHKDAEIERDKCVWRFTNFGTTPIKPENCPYTRVPDSVDP